MYGGNTNVVVNRFFAPDRPQSMNVSHRKYMRTMTIELKEKQENNKTPSPEKTLPKFPKQGKILMELTRPKTQTVSKRRNINTEKFFVTSKPEI